MLRSADVRGTIRVKIADKSYDARIDADQAKAGNMSPPAPAASDTDKGSESGKATGSYGK